MIALHELLILLINYNNMATNCLEYLLEVS